jgi:AraC-like DNA-binding protein
MSAPLPDPFSNLSGLAEENRTHASYRWDNRGRGDKDEGVIQQTLSGAGFFEDGAGRRLVPAGHTILFTHDEASSYGYPPEVTAPYRLRFVSFRLLGLRGLFDGLRGEFGAVLRMAVEGEASAVVREIGRRLRTRTFRDRFQEAELLHQLLVALYREQVAATQIQDPVEYGHHFLRDNFRSPINLKEVAEHCGVSREHFIRAFGKRFGEPPGELMRRLRLEQAQRMLGATQLAIQEVATACGFTDANTFCRAYRLRYGTSPGAARTRKANR